MTPTRSATTLLIALLLAPLSGLAASFSELSSEPFGVFAGTEFVRHTGRFEGTTSSGDYSVPFEVVAPAEPSAAPRPVLFEAPHWAVAPFGRDLIIGRNVIFNRGISYAAVGFGVDGGNILDPTLPDLQIAGSPVPAPGEVIFSGPTDGEIIVQFVEAMRAAPAEVGLGQISDVYAYGVSRSADILTAIQQTVTGTDSASLFDLTFLHSPAWEVEVEAPPPGGFFAGNGGEYVPPTDVGRVMFVLAEADQIVFRSEVFRAVAGLEGHRIYEVTGAAHTPTVPELGDVDVGDNPLDHYDVMRAIFVAGHRWMRDGDAPPADRLLEAAPEGQIDPVYEFETGIARDADGNALGGVRLPKLAAGLSLFIAADPSTSNFGIPPLAPLTGGQVDLECAPLPDGSERFRFRRDYDWQITRQVLELVETGFLLRGDGIPMIFEAVDSQIGRDQRCESQ